MKDKQLIEGIAKSLKQYGVFCKAPYSIYDLADKIAESLCLDEIKMERVIYLQSKKHLEKYNKIHTPEVSKALCSNEGIIKVKE